MAYFPCPFCGAFYRFGGKMPKTNSLSGFSEKLLQGSGLGNGPDYRPWHDARTTNSDAVVSQTLGIKTGRIHHGLSPGEKSFFYLIEFDERVIDIREQFPLLPLSLAISNADALGIRYPKIPRTKTPWVMTTDFLITYLKQGKIAYTAFSVKSRSRFGTKADFEKQELERIWWESLGIPWKIFFNDEDEKIVSQNICWLSQPLRDGLRVEREKSDAVLREVQKGVYDYAHLMAELGQRLDIPQDQVSDIFRTLAWNHVIKIDVRDAILKEGIINVISKSQEERKLYGTSDF